MHKQNWKSPFCIDGFPYRRKKEKERGYCAFLRLFALPPARPVSSRIAFIAPATSPYCAGYTGCINKSCILCNQSVGALSDSLQLIASSVTALLEISSGNRDRKIRHIYLYIIYKTEYIYLKYFYLKNNICKIIVFCIL